MTANYLAAHLDSYLNWLTMSFPDLQILEIHSIVCFFGKVI